MRIVIEISEEYYNRCKDYVSANDADYHHIKIANGTPLPESYKEVNDEKEETAKIQ